MCEVLNSYTIQHFSTMRNKIVLAMLTALTLLAASCSVRKSTNEPWTPNKAKTKIPLQYRGRV